MSGVISASVSAGPLFVSSEGIVMMIGGLFIHGVTPEVARQWITSLEEIAKEGE